MAIGRFLGIATVVTTVGCGARSGERYPEDVPESLAPILQSSEPNAAGGRGNVGAMPVMTPVRDPANDVPMNVLPPNLVPGTPAPAVGGDTSGPSRGGAPPTGTPAGGNTASAGSPATPSGVDETPSQCGANDLGMELGVVAAGQLVRNAPDVATNSCNGEGPAVTYVWTAPVTASYQLSTEGSSFDTVLVIRPEPCSNEELACNDDDNGIYSVVRMGFEQGQVIGIDITSYANDIEFENVADYQLDITAVLR